MEISEDLNYGAVYVWCWTVSVVRYAGSTGQYPRKSRREDYDDWISRPHQPDHRWRPVHVWLDEQRRGGYSPWWRVVVDGVPYRERRELELVEDDFIKFYESQGCDLLNERRLRLTAADRVTLARMRLVVSRLPGAEEYRRWLESIGALRRG